MTLQLIQTIISILSGIVALFWLAVAIIKWIKNGNAKKTLALISVIPELVKEAEQMFGKGHGADKFKWVMTTLKNMALETKTKFDATVIGNQVNDVVDATNNVNVDKFPFSTETGICETKTVDSVSKNNESRSNATNIVQIIGDNKNV